MELSSSILTQLKIIKWLVLFVFLCILATASSITFFSITAAHLAETTLADSPASCTKESFRDQISNLLDEGKLEETIISASKRIKTHPYDENAYWYRGLSFYLQKKWQPAIDDFNKVEELAPSWKDRYVEPYRTAAKSRL